MAIPAGQQIRTPTPEILSGEIPGPGTQSGRIPEPERQPRRVPEPERQSRRFPGHAIENLNFLIVEPMHKKDWGEWTSEQFQAGLGQAIQGIVSGIIVGLGQIFIQKTIEELKGKAEQIFAKPNVAEQELKIAIITGECDALIESSGIVKKTVMELLAKAQKEEPQNHSTYLMGVANCKIERIKKNSGNPA
jgi:hypothetical protein